LKGIRKKLFCFLNVDFELILPNLSTISVRKPMHNFTPEDLLLYLYKESSPEQAAAIEETLKQDWTLREKLAVMKTAMERLNNLTVSPRTETVLNVLKYAAAQQPVKTS
jgi:hypothetical protein